jgi:ERCC4-type nuclease
MSKYFVSYFWKTLLRNGSGMCVISTDNGMETAEGLIEMQKAIKEENRFRKCVIINYKKLGDSDSKEQTSESL